jgi:hypothetical protein
VAWVADSAVASEIPASDLAAVGLGQRSVQPAAYSDRLGVGVVEPLAVRGDIVGGVPGAERVAVSGWSGAVHCEAGVRPDVRALNTGRGHRHLFRAGVVGDKRDIKDKRLGIAWSLRDRRPDRRGDKRRQKGQKAGFCPFCPFVTVTPHLRRTGRAGCSVPFALLSPGTSARRGDRRSGRNRGAGRSSRDRPGGQPRATSPPGS